MTDRSAASAHSVAPHDLGPDTLGRDVFDSGALGLDDSGQPAWWRHFEGRDLPDIAFVEKPLTDFLDFAAEQHGQRTAIEFQNYKLSYTALREQAETFAAALRLRGVNEGDRVAIMLPNIPQTIIAFWGVLKAGAVAVMTNPLYMEKELTHHFEDSQSKVLVTLDLLWPKLEPLMDRIDLKLCVITRIADGLAFPLSWLQPWKAKREGNLPVVPHDGQKFISWKDAFKTRERYSAPIGDPKRALALLQYTGGTTGFSKAAMLTHQNLSAQMQILKYIVGGDAQTKRFVFLSIMPFFHVFGLAGNILMPCLYAGSSIPVPRYTPGDLLRTIKKYRPNFFVGAPSVYISLIQQKDIAKYDLTCIELCISGSSPFPVEALHKFQKLTGANVTEGFGLTEASPCLLANPVYATQKNGSVGVPLPATEARIVDLETGEKIMGDNEIGELIARGPQVMVGYWNKPEETAATLRDGWLYTGDIAYRDEDGYYFIVDRKKDMAIVGGYNVYPREIDEVLYEHPKVAEAVAVGVPHRSRGETLKAYVVPKPGENLTVQELVTHCREKLANYKVPKFFELREELPKTLVGKVLRRMLREEEAQKIKDGTSEHDNNYTVEVIHKVGEAATSAKGKAGEFVEHAREQAEEFVGQAREKAGVFMEQARERAGELREQAEDFVEKAKKKSQGSDAKSTAPTENAESGSAKTEEGKKE